MNKPKLLSYAAYGRLHGVTRQRVSQWVAHGMIRTVSLVPGEPRIWSNTPRPKNKKAGAPRKLLK
jgi:hypothetical protein